MMYMIDMMKTVIEYGAWEKWFAWYPVELMSGNTVWLVWVKRMRITQYYCDGHATSYWEYDTL